MKTDKSCSLFERWMTGFRSSKNPSRGISEALNTLGRLQLAFRSVQNTIADMKSQVRRALRVKDAASDPYAEDLEASVELYLRSKAEDFDVTKNIQVG